MSHPFGMDPQPPTELSRHLHEMSRVDGRFRHVGNVLPNFTYPLDDDGDGNDGPETYGRRYLEGLLMAVAIPVLLVLTYAIVEYLVRAVVACCSCCNRKPAAPHEEPLLAGQQQQQQQYHQGYELGGPAAMAGGPSPVGAVKRKDRLHKTRCWKVTAALLTLLTVGLSATLVARGGDLRHATGVVSDSFSAASATLEAARGSAGDTMGASGVATAALQDMLDGVAEMPADVRADLEAAAAAAERTSGSAAELGTRLRDVAFEDVAHQVRVQNKNAYGTFGWNFQASVGVPALVLLYVLTEALITRRKRGWCLSAVLILCDVVVLSLLVALVAVSFVQLGLMMGVADACHDPIPTADRILTAHYSDADVRERVDVARFYLYCDAEHADNPLNDTLADAYTALDEVRPGVVRAREWAGAQGNETVRELGERAAHTFGEMSSSVHSTGDGLGCAELHNEAVTALDAACDPMTERSVRLLALQATLAVVLLFFRGAAVYRCCRCCYRTDAEAGSHGRGRDLPLDYMGAGAGAGAGYAPYGAAPPSEPVPAAPVVGGGAVSYAPVHGAHSTTHTH